MIVARSYPRTIEGLLENILEKMSEAKDIVVHAGHFQLYFNPDTAILIPCIASELATDCIPKSRSMFPLLSWELGLHLLDRMPGTTRHAMILVNDWQYLPPDVLRDQFYDNHRFVPAAYASALERTKSGIKLLTPETTSPTWPFFGEMNLRNQYQKIVARMIERHEMPADALVERKADNVSCTIRGDSGYHWDVYRSNYSGNCATEVAQMLNVAFKRTHCDSFINLFPSVCQDLVEGGTELGMRLFKLKVKNVCNVSLCASDVYSLEEMLLSCEVTHHTFNT